MKKTIALLLCIFLMVATFAACNSDNDSKDDTKSSDWKYELDGETAAITGYTGSAAEVKIPDKLDGKTVTSIGEEAFYDCVSIESITIPNSVTEIGPRAFCDCTALSSITIPNSVKFVSFWPFLRCESLKDIYYTGSKSDWDSVFFGCGIEELTDVTVHYNWVPVTNDAQNAAN